MYSLTLSERRGLPQLHINLHINNISNYYNYNNLSKRKCINNDTIIHKPNKIAKLT